MKHKTKYDPNFDSPGTPIKVNHPIKKEVVTNRSGKNFFETWTLLTRLVQEILHLQYLQ